MSEREEGLYWCKVKQCDDWCPVEWAGGKWVVGPIDCQADVLECAQRIPTPDEIEGWQLVPVEPTREMVIAYEREGGDVENAAFDWKIMLAAAPTPGGGYE